MTFLNSELFEWNQYSISYIDGSGGHSTALLCAGESGVWAWFCGWAALKKLLERPMGNDYLESLPKPASHIFFLICRPISTLWHVWLVSNVKFQNGDTFFSSFQSDRLCSLWCFKKIYFGSYNFPLCHLLAITTCPVCYDVYVGRCDFEIHLGLIKLYVSQSRMQIILWKWLVQRPLESSH